jgi:pimeloyl-ACP methyl ester carboxylesterase
VDLSGHGGSDPAPHAPYGADTMPGTDDDPYRIDALADDVVLAAESLGGPVVLVGWSSGAQASLIAASRSDAIAGLVLVGAAPRTRLDPALHPTYNGGATLLFGRALTGALARDAWRDVVGAMFTPDAPATMIDGAYAHFMSLDATTRRAQLAARQADLIDALASVAQPTLVLHGVRDDVHLVESARYLAEHIPDARLLVFGESGHTPFLEEPDRFDHALHAFLTELEGGAP